MRQATHEDLPELLAMAEEFVSSGRKEMVWGKQTAGLYEDIFRQLIGWQNPAHVPGALVLEPGAGFACAVEIPHETPWGRVASGWGIYVCQSHRGEGLGRLLHAYLCETLRSRGFVGLITGSDSPEGAAILRDLEPISSYGLIHLDRLDKEGV